MVSTASWHISDMRLVNSALSSCEITSSNPISLRNTLNSCSASVDFSTSFWNSLLISSENSLCTRPSFSNSSLDFTSTPLSFASTFSIPDISSDDSITDRFINCVFSWAAYIPAPTAATPTTSGAQIEARLPMLPTSPAPPRLPNAVLAPLITLLNFVNVPIPPPTTLSTGPTAAANAIHFITFCCSCSDNPANASPALLNTSDTFVITGINDAPNFIPSFLNLFKAPFNCSAGVASILSKADCVAPALLFMASSIPLYS